MHSHVVWFSKLGMGDVDSVGGKNASLGEMISGLHNKGVSVPDGFATTAHAYREFIKHEGLDERIRKALDSLDVEDVKQLAKVGAEIREAVVATPFPETLDRAMEQAFSELQQGNAQLSVAVRSSATAEDLPDASFAGQQETFLNIKGIDNVKVAVKEVFASLFNDRAIAYRVHKGFDHEGVALSAGIQRMVRSETGSAGVMFTIDTESGFDGVVFVTGSYGLGETVVQGSVNPDEFYVSKRALAAGQAPVLRRNRGSKAIKMIYGEQASAGLSVTTVDVDAADRLRFSISDEEVVELARQAVIIEQHYGRSMDIEWAKDGDDGKLYIVQARPETVKSQQSSNTIERYLLKERADVLCEGRSIGQRIGQGRVRLV
ncbi:MAG: phosphoenolpyruvate synthase, partial [Pseudomonadales bacterium]|nr:phosphoenolpyruvate synthase [Pseudomonadales bacterium]